ncbi:hypothetical protein TrVE_jg7126 [Triparma verrucosa]|nr:hypothetical protein TrVE_jg7126 [Triparma verrucosa]
MTTDEVTRKKFGLTESQLARAKSLRQMGVTEDDLQIAAQIIALMPPQPTKQSSSKSELMMGYDSTRLNREKALKLLGVSEEQLDVENGKILGSLGITGSQRKRSFRITRSVSAPVLKAANEGGGKRGSWFSGRRSSVRSKRGSSVFEDVFKGWNCAAAFGAIEEGPTMLEQLQTENEQQKYDLEMLRKKVKAMEIENKQIREDLEERKRKEEEENSKPKGWFSR